MVESYSGSGADKSGSKSDLLLFPSPGVSTWLGLVLVEQAFSFCPWAMVFRIIVSCYVPNSPEHFTSEDLFIPNKLISEYSYLPL